MLKAFTPERWSAGVASCLEGPLCGAASAVVLSGRGLSTRLAQISAVAPCATRVITCVRGSHRIFLRVVPWHCQVSSHSPDVVAY